MIVIDLMGEDNEEEVTTKKEAVKDEPRQLPRKRLSIININGEIVDFED